MDERCYIRVKRKEDASKGEYSLFYIDFIGNPLPEHFQIFNSPEDKSTFNSF
jgi:hypothetical protein